MTRSRPAEPIRICDTTLRDGEQAPGLAFSVAVKLQLARLLDRVGVAEIEAGTPACGGDEARAVRAIAELQLSCRITAWCRTSVSDIAAAAECGVAGVAIAVPSSRTHIRSKLGRTPSWVATRMVECIDYAKSRGLYVCAAFEDGSRADPEFLTLLARRAWWTGADRLRLSDTVAAFDPFHVARAIRRLGAATDLPLEFHGHNDFGLSTANALAAARAGASHLSVTALGVGERAGNAALEEVALALERLHGRSTGIRTGAFPELFAAVSQATGRPIPPGKPVAGQHAFTHESGIHVDGVLKDPDTYEPYPPELVGAARRIVLGKHSGTAALGHRLGALGLGATRAEVRALLPAVRQWSQAAAATLGDEELRALWEATRTPAKRSVAP